MSGASGIGAQSMVAPLRRVAVRAPDQSFAEADPEQFHYSSSPDLARARVEHEGLVRVLEAAGCEVLRHDRPLPGLADAIFVHDPVLVTDAGVLVLRMGKALRRGEEEALAAFLEAHDVPVFARLEGTATAEGGDLLWLDADTLCVGLGYRTNLEGARQLQAALRPLHVEVLAFDLPVAEGPAACLHLQSLISLVDERRALVVPPLLPVRFHQLLVERGFELLEVSPEEVPTLGPNVLALAPGECLVVEGNPRTREGLERAGCKVASYRGEEISLKAEGGPTCLTRPVLRAR